MTLPASTTSAQSEQPHPRRLGLVVVALVLGGVGIGITEFVTMGLLPRSPRTSEPTSRPRAT